MEKTKSFLRNAVTGLALIAGMSSTILLPSCTQGRISQTNQRPESKLLYRVSIESEEELADVSVVDSKGKVVYELMKNGNPLTELKMEKRNTGGRNGNIFYDYTITSYSLRLPQPLQSDKDYSIVSKTISGEIQKNNLNPKK